MGFADKLKQKIKDATDSVMSTIANEEVQEKRLEICESCPFLNTIRQCKKCGCLVDAKVKLAGSSCPMKKW